MLSAFLARYATQLLGSLLAFAVVIGGYYYWKHDIVTEALNKQQAKLTKQSEILFKQKQEEVLQAENKSRERAINAIQVYAKHYDELRAAANAIPERVYISTKTNSCSNAMPGTSQGRSSTATGIGRSGQAELSSENIRELNKTISMIEDMQLKCERLLNTLE